MFSENFSFGTSIRPLELSVSTEEDCTSSEVSPFTSRPPSPYSTTSAARRDSRFDAYRPSPRHRSITALTAQLQSHALHDTDMRTPSPPPSEITSPSDTTLDDEGFCDGPDTPATMTSDDSFDSSNDVEPALWDLSMSDTLVATSSPRPSLSLEAQALSSFTMRRRQRQALVRLQCLATRTPDLAMLIEECHPSSLPFETGILRSYVPGKGRSESTSVPSMVTSGRIEKERSGSTAAARKTPRLRKKTN